MAIFFAIMPDILGTDARFGPVSWPPGEGLRYSFTQRTAFSALQGDAPKASGTTVLTSPRYDPF